MFGTRTRAVGEGGGEGELARLETSVLQWREQLSSLREQRAELQKEADDGSEDARPRLRSMDILKQKLIW